MRSSSVWPYEPRSSSLTPSHAQPEQHTLPPSILSPPPASSYLAALRQLKSNTSSQTPTRTDAGPATCLGSSFVAGSSSSRRVPPPAELSWTCSRVVLSSGGVPVRTFSFEGEGQSVRQALFGWFPLPASCSSSSAHQQQPTTSDAGPPLASTSASTLDPSSSTFGPFHRTAPPPWTDDPLALASWPSAALTQSNAPLARWVVVLLGEIGYAYPPTGGSVPFQIPFKLGRAWSLDRGIVISRAEGESAELPFASKATLYSLLDPARELAPISSSKSLSNLFAKPDAPGRKPAVRVEEPLEKVVDPADGLVFVAEGRDGAEPLAVSANAGTGVISLWAYAHLPNEIEEKRRPSAWGNANPFAGGGVKGKERAEPTNAPPLSSSTSRRATNSALPPGRRRKSSIGGANLGPVRPPGQLAHLDRIQRRGSGMGAGVALDARSSSFTGQPSTGAGAGLGYSIGDTSGQMAEADLLEALGESLAMKRTTSSALGNAISAAVDRRSSLTRNELSITMDRMAIGVAQSAEMDREATTILGPHTEEEPDARSELVVSKVWEMELELEARPEGWAEGMAAHVFDSRAGRGSTLAILIPATQTLLLLAISRSAEGAIAATPLYALAARACTTVIATRAQVLDLLVLKTDGTWSLVTASGKEESVQGPPVPSGRTVQTLEGDGTGLVVLQFDDGSRHSSTLPAPASGLTRRALEVISLSLDLETFNTFQRSVTEWKAREGAKVSDWEALEGVLLAVFGKSPASAPTPRASPWKAFSSCRAGPSLRDPLMANLRSSGGASPVKMDADGPAQLPLAQLEAIILGLHLLAQDSKLRTATQGDYTTLAALLFSLSSALRLPQWVTYYRSPTSTLPTPFFDPPVESRLPAQPVDLIATLSGMLAGRPPKTDIWDPSYLGTQLGFEPSEFYGPVQPCITTREVFIIYHALTIATAPTPADRVKMAVYLMGHTGWTIEKLDKLAYGVSLPLREALRLCQLDAPDGWPANAYQLIRRPDLAMQLAPARASSFVQKKPHTAARLPIDKIANLTKAGLPLEPPAGAAPEGPARDAAPVPLAIRYGEDRRLEEVQRMLQFSEPVTISAGDRSLDQLTPNVQQSVLHALSHRTLALPIGYAMLHFRTKTHASTEAIPIPSLNCSARILPMLSPVSPLDKDARDGHAITSSERMEWPEFHTGVAAALQLNSREGTFDAAQISFNRPQELDPKHAGFLFGLGLSGHAGGMMFSQAFEYLKMKHEPTSIGLLLGLAVTYLGTADPKVTSLLSVHLAALHPPGSSPLNVSSMTQAAGLVGIGLLYMGTQRRSLGEILLRELCKIKVVTIETPHACREAYALSAGFAYGLINLAKGHISSSSEPAPAGEAGTLSTFRALILGETNHPLPGTPASANVTDVNITSAPATIALGLMYLRTNRPDVAGVLEMPTTKTRLDYVRGDLLLLRTLARCLVMWDAVQSDKEWVERHVPRFIARAVKIAVETKSVLDPDLDIARWNIIAGACMGMGLKFAGTAAAEAHATLIHFLDRLTRAAYVKAPTVQAKIKRHAIRCCLSVVGIALSLVMAGTGEINVLRRLRVAHGHFSEGVTYGTHLASHMSLGMLFVGSGYYTLGTSNAAIAALTIAFFPTLPSTAAENRAHLQALRHLWVLAVEPRCVEARDVDTGERTFLPVRLRVREGKEMRAKQLVTPTLMPELKLVDSIQVDSPRYWTFALGLQGAAKGRFVRDQTLWIKRRTGHLSYAEDPRGIRSIFTRSKSEAGSAVFDWGENARMLSPNAAGLADFVAAFEDGGAALAAVEWLCFNPLSKKGEKRASAWEAFASSVLLECLTRDKPDTVPVYLSLFLTRQVLGTKGQLGPDALLALEQAQFVVDFYDRAAGGGYEALFGQAKSRLKASAARERLVQKALVSHLSSDLDKLARPQGLHARELVQAIRSYLGTTAWPSEAQLAARLALWLRVNKAPDEESLESLRQTLRERKVRAGEEGALADGAYEGMEWWEGKMREAVGTELGMGSVWSAQLGAELIKSLE